MRGINSLWISIASSTQGHACFDFLTDLVAHAPDPPPPLTEEQLANAPPRTASGSTSAAVTSHVDQVSLARAFVCWCTVLVFAPSTHGMCAPRGGRRTGGPAYSVCIAEGTAEGGARLHRPGAVDGPSPRQCLVSLQGRQMRVRFTVSLGWVDAPVA